MKQNDTIVLALILLLLFLFFKSPAASSKDVVQGGGVAGISPFGGNNTAGLRPLAASQPSSSGNPLQNVLNGIQNLLRGLGGRSAGGPQAKAPTPSMGGLGGGNRSQNPPLPPGLAMNPDEQVTSMDNPDIGAGLPFPNEPYATSANLEFGGSYPTDYTSTSTPAESSTTSPEPYPYYYDTGGAYNTGDSFQYETPVDYTSGGAGASNESGNSGGDFGNENYNYSGDYIDISGGGGGFDSGGGGGGWGGGDVFYS